MSIWIDGRQRKAVAMIATKTAEATTIHEKTEEFELSLLPSLFSFRFQWNIRCISVLRLGSKYVYASVCVYCICMMNRVIILSRHFCCDARISSAAMPTTQSQSRSLCQCIAGKKNEWNEEINSMRSLSVAFRLDLYICPCVLSWALSLALTIFGMCFFSSFYVTDDILMLFLSIYYLLTTEKMSGDNETK